MSRVASSTASTRVMATGAALVAVYIEVADDVTSMPTMEMFTMVPPAESL